MPREMAKRIRLLIKQRGGWAQLERKLRARGTTLTESTMSRLINGDTEPKLGTLQAIADALEVELRDLLLPNGSDVLPIVVPAAHWVVGTGLMLTRSSKNGLVLSADMLPAGRTLVALQTAAANMAPMIEPGDTLVLDLGQDVPEGSKVLIADPGSGRERLMWMHRVGDDIVQYSDLNGYLMGPPDLMKGRVHLVIRQPRRLVEPMPAPPKEGWTLQHELVSREAR